jgi:hypothetical protein
MIDWELSAAIAEERFRYSNNRWMVVTRQQCETIAGYARKRGDRPEGDGHYSCSGGHGVKMRFDLSKSSIEI